MPGAGLDRFGRFVNRRELEALQARLAPGERLLAAAEARLQRPGILAVTTQRVVHLSKGWLRTRMQAWPHRAVRGMAVATNVDDAALTLQAPAPALFRMRKADAKLIQAAWQSRPPGPGELLDFALPPAQRRQQERLARLDRQFARGTITKAEYERAKRNVAAGDEG